MVTVSQVAGSGHKNRDKVLTAGTGRCKHPLQPTVMCASQVLNTVLDTHKNLLKCN